MIDWSIDVAKEVPCICDILVSTDSEEIARVARQAGALVPWLRPASLATDTASSVDAALHGLDWYETERGTVDGLLLLQPTSPFRSRETVERGIDLFRHEGFRPVIGVSPAKSHPMWCFKVHGSALSPFIEDGGLHLRSQDLPPAYTVNGAFYLISSNDLRRDLSFYSEAAIPLIMDDEQEAIDIDNEWDWKMAESSIAR